jgi:hypothetical protein
MAVHFSQDDPLSDCNVAVGKFSGERRRRMIRNSTHPEAEMLREFGCLGPRSGAVSHATSFSVEGNYCQGYQCPQFEFQRNPLRGVEATAYSHQLSKIEGCHKKLLPRCTVFGVWLTGLQLSRKGKHQPHGNGHRDRPLSDPTASWTALALGASHSQYYCGRSHGLPTANSMVSPSGVNA